METMTSPKIEVLWSPVHHNKFIVWGPDITLYEVGLIKEMEDKKSFINISPTRGASVVASHSAHGVRCMDLSAMPDLPDPLLALGFTSGKVGLTTMKQIFDPMGFTGRVFAPKYPRLCNAVSWSHTETNMLAVAMEKHRSDHCILIWDVHRDTLPWSEVNDTSPPEQPRPLAEMGLSETAHSVSWANCGHRTLVASMNLKHIKVFDLRDWSNKGVSSTGRGAWAGATAAPGGWLVAARGEGGAAVWDLRRLHQPLLTLHHPRPVHALHWCPTRRNLLLTLQKDSSSVRLYDIQHAHDNKNNNNTLSNEVVVAPAVEADVEECGGGEAGAGAAALEREVTPGAPAHPLLAAAWHPAHDQRLLAYCATGSIVDYTVCERVTLAWGGGHGGGGGLVWTAGANALHHMHHDFYNHVNDISHVMKRRAQTDYGLKPDLWQNADLAEDEAVGAMWHFLALSKSLVEDGCIRGCGASSKHPGVASVLGAGGYRSEGGVLVVGDVPARRVGVWRSSERAAALQLCGWGWGWDSWAAGVERAEAEGTPCRAAALAAFHLRVRAALDVLARAREPQLRVVALALAGLGDERLWRDALAAARPALPDPYLRALLAFLAATQGAPAAGPHPPPDYAAVLGETGMRLEDRVAFACIYLDDARLAEWVRWCGEEAAARGELPGLLLTGLGPEGVRLLANWGQRTSDVQTLALVAARCASPDLMQNNTVQHWLDSYRMLLDSWQLWWARCALDTCVRAGAGAEPEGRQIAVACTYCGKSVAAPPPRPGVRPPLARLPPPAAKMKQTSSCPNCRKPLPRCGVCSLHLGTAVGGAPFATWFTWCLACRHGGHAAHLIDWFSEHTECPVSSCNCRCSMLDPPDRHCT